MPLTVPEQLYAGPLGDAYLRRQPERVAQRRPFWDHLTFLTQPRSVLEVGCGVGDNLAALPTVPMHVGVDINAAALKQLRTRGRGAAVLSSAGDLPFHSQSFDLVFTCGLLIHIPKAQLDQVYSELVRVAQRWVLTIEYEDDQEREIPWHGVREVLWARPYTAELGWEHWGLALTSRGQLVQDQGFDRCEYALFRKVG